MLINSVFCVLFLLLWGFLAVIVSFIIANINKETIKNIAQKEAISILSEDWIKDEDLKDTFRAVLVCKLLFLYRCTKYNECRCEGCDKSSMKIVKEVVSEKLNKRINSIHISRNIIINNYIKKYTRLAILSKIIPSGSRFDNIKIVSKETVLKQFKPRN